MFHEIKYVHWCFTHLHFSLLFLYTGSDPVTVALLPIALFAILHSASYSLTLLDTIGKEKIKNLVAPRLNIPITIISSF